MVALDNALSHLAEMDTQLAQVVELKFFGGRTNKETAEVLGLSERRIERAWSTGKAWLKGQMSEGENLSSEE
jgi:DNA-directed RNA polymerase specialized sigma subunit